MRVRMEERGLTNCDRLWEVHVSVVESSETLACRSAPEGRGNRFTVFLQDHLANPGHPSQWFVAQKSHWTRIHSQTGNKLYIVAIRPQLA
jgi:hypothetical protein